MVVAVRVFRVGLMRAVCYSICTNVCGQGRQTCRSLARLRDNVFRVLCVVCHLLIVVVRAADQGGVSA